MSKLAFNKLFSGKHNFLVGSNLTTFFAIGDFMEKEDFYMMGWHNTNGDFVINAKIFTSEGKPLFELENNELTYNYENSFMLETIEDKQGILDSMKITDKKIIPIYAQKTHQELTIDGNKSMNNVTEILGRFHNKSGELVAIGSKNGMTLNKIKSVMGATKSGSFGIVMGCSKDEMKFLQNLVKTFLG